MYDVAGMFWLKVFLLRFSLFRYVLARSVFQFRLKKRSNARNFA